MLTDNSADVIKQLGAGFEQMREIQAGQAGRFQVRLGGIFKRMLAVLNDQSQCSKNTEQGRAKHHHQQRLELKFLLWLPVNSVRRS